MVSPVKKKRRLGIRGEWKEGGEAGLTKDMKEKEKKEKKARKQWWKEFQAQELEVKEHLEAMARLETILKAWRPRP